MRNKRPTPQMLSALLQIYERELAHLEPVDAFMIPSAQGLILRGLVITRDYLTAEGKSIVVLYTTERGQLLVKEDSIPKGEKMLTGSMLEMLMDCHERELMGLPPCDFNFRRPAAALITRNLLTSSERIDKSGKSKLHLTTTSLGRDYLNDLNK